MALKFLNKKGWHTGSLRNIENVWKAEQKHEAEQRKLEELKKQIKDEREALEFRQLQEHAGLVPKQERLEFLYSSGLSVGKSSTDDYLLGKPIETSQGDNDVAKAAAAPGANFVEEKRQSANDTWRKLHSDPLLLIRQQEQAALAQIRNNPVKMEMIKKSIEEKLSKKQEKQKRKDEKRQQSKKRKCEKLQRDCSEQGIHIKESNRLHKEGKEADSGNEQDRNGFNLGKKSSRGQMNNKEGKFSKQSKHDISEHRRRHDSPDFLGKERHKHDSSHRRRHDTSDSFGDEEGKPRKEDRDCFRRSARDVRKDNICPEGQVSKLSSIENPFNFSNRESRDTTELNQNCKQKSKYQATKLSEEDKAARLKEMQMDAEAHEEQRWHRLKKASEADILEETRKSTAIGRNFLDQTAQNVYGADKGGSGSVQESVRRRTHFIERSIGDSNINTFQRS